MNNRYPTPMNDEDRREYDEYESRVRRMFDPNGDREAERQQFADEREYSDEYCPDDDEEQDEYDEAEEARFQQEEDDRIDREYNEMMLWRDYHQEEEDAEEWGEGQGRGGGRRGGSGGG